jgi:predicted transcriptional regulator of viral defense system
MTNKKDALARLAEKHGIVRARDLKALGIGRAVLRSLVQEGTIVREARGLYSHKAFRATEAHSLVEASCTQSKGVVCLTSALGFHGVGTQLPSDVWLAVPKGTRIAERRELPIRVVVLNRDSYEAGIETHIIEGVHVRIYSVAKTVADCFKFRSKVGLDVALEALKEALRDRRCTRDEILGFAQIDRVANVMRPYIEALSA